MRDFFLNTDSETFLSAGNRADGFGNIKDRGNSLINSISAPDQAPNEKGSYPDLWKKPLLLPD
jgi:hypothetical protein